MKKLKILTLLALALFTLQSCKDNFADDFASTAKLDVQVVGDRLSFKDTKTFNTTLTAIAKMSQGQFDAWRNEYEFPALYNKIDLLGVNKLKTLPYWYQAVMNESGELIVGDTVVWFSQTGDIHYIPKMNQSELASIKSGEQKTFKKDNWNVTTIQSSPEKMARIPNFTGSDARWQPQFNLNNDPNSLRKFVFELQSVNVGSNCELFINMKAEWYGSVSHNWSTATEYREFYWDVVCDATLYGNGGVVLGTPFNIRIVPTTSWTGTTDHQVFLGSIFAFGARYWDVDVSKYGPYGGLFGTMPDTVYPYNNNDLVAPDTGTVLW